MTSLSAPGSFLRASAAFFKNEWHHGIFIEPLRMQFAIPLSRDAGPLFRQVYLALRQAILSGTFHVNGRLPSTRDLADQLGISRTVVLLAYDQLLAEGFVAGRRGSGTYVSAGLGSNRLIASKKSPKLRLSTFGSAAAAAVPALDVHARRSPSLRYDFASGRSESDIETFPFEMWRRILLRCARRVPVVELEYGPAAGSLTLRSAICAHLRRSRAVVCDPSEIIIVNGSQQALDLIVRVLLERGDRVAIENPSYQGTREILLAAGIRLLPVPVDRDGVIPSKLPDHARLCFVTPSHQYPTGAILSLGRRLALLEWAKRTNSVIVEDDYDGEFRYEGHPLESLQGLDSEGRIIYVGTFSRTVFPALRVGYLIVPKSLTQAFTAAKWLNDQHSATLEQQALAEFVSSGAYERHLRRVRRRNAARRKALLDAIAKYLDGRVEVTGDGSGAHVVLWPKKRVSEDAIVASAASRSVGISGISRYFLTKPTRSGLMLGYCRMNEEGIREGVRRLGEIL
jgi:GntR family transcriptional regulator / MocR family aminotransferase